MEIGDTFVACLAMWSWIQIMHLIFGQGHFDSFVTDALSFYRSKLVEHVKLGHFQNVLDQTKNIFSLLNFTVLKRFPRILVGKVDEIGIRFDK